MKKSLFLFLLLIASSTMFSQIFWGVRNTGFSQPSRGVLDISYADANNVWFQVVNAAPASGGVPAPPVLEFARSSNGGNTWVTGNINVTVNGPLANNSVSSFQAVSATTCYVGTGKIGLFKTSDGGLTWVNKTPGLFSQPDSYFNFGIFVDSNVGITAGDPPDGYMEIYRTTNGGDSWSRIPSSSIAPILVGEYMFTGSFSQKGNAMYYFTNKGRTFRSLDAGLTWQAFLNPLAATNDTPGGKLCLKSELEGFYYDPTAAIIDRVFYKTTDGGETYIEVIPSGVTRVRDITFVPGTLDTYIANGITNTDPQVGRGTSISCDGGLNWEDINQLGDNINVNYPTAISFFNTTNGLAAGTNTNSTVGGIFKYVGPTMGDSASACPSPIASASTFSQANYKLSPNPTADRFTVTGLNINQVQVTDVLGKVVMNNTYAALSNVELNIAGFNAGIYMVKVTDNEGKFAVTKVIKQ